MPKGRDKCVLLLVLVRGVVSTKMKKNEQKRRRRGRKPTGKIQRTCENEGRQPKYRAVLSEDEDGEEGKLDGVF